MKTITTLLLTVTLAVPMASTAQNTRRSVSTNTNGRQPVTSCRDFDVMFDRRPAVTDESEMTLTPSQVSVLRAQASNNGIYVSGWDRSEYSVRTCKAVPSDDSNPTQTLRDISTVNSGGSITINGPSGHEWIANLIIL